MDRINRREVERERERENTAMENNINKYLFQNVYTHSLFETQKWKE